MVGEKKGKREIRAQKIIQSFHGSNSYKLGERETI